MTRAIGLHICFTEMPLPRLIQIPSAAANPPPHPRAQSGMERKASRPALLKSAPKIRSALSLDSALPLYSRWIRLSSHLTHWNVIVS